MTTQTEALKMALEALETYHGYMEPLLTVFGGPRVPAEKSTTYKVEKAITAIKKALAQPEQEPVAWKLVPIKPTEEMLKAMDEYSIEGYDERLYAGHASSVYMAAVDVAPTPPQRTWIGLTEEDMDWLHANTPCIEGNYGYRFIKAIEAKLKEKNA